MKSSELATKVYDKLPSPFRDTAILKLFGFFNIPLLFFCGPQVVELNERRCVIKIPLGLRSKNHLGSMYFGALACGADCAGGLAAMKQIILSGENIKLVFKDFHAEFLKRPMGDVYFTCEDGAEIAGLIQRVIKSGEREHIPVKIVATEPKQFGTGPVALFTLTLSLKKKG